MLRKAIASLATILLGVLLLLGNVVQSLSFVLKPFSPKAFRRLNRFIADKWWGGCVLVVEKLGGTKLEFSGDKLPLRENAIVISNHRSMSDIVILLCIAFRKGRLGDLKWFVKDPVKYVPGIGWGMRFLDCLFVKREWAADRASIDRTFARLLGHNTPLWLVSFLEGTRRTPVKLARSHQFAAQRGWRPLQHLLVPRTKGFVASVRALSSHVEAVYDVTLGYEGRRPPTLGQLFFGVPSRVCVHLRRFPVASLPKDDARLAQWVQELYREKDELLAHFEQHGVFPQPHRREPLPVRSWLTGHYRAGKLQLSE